MLIEKELIIEAKNKFGDKAIELIKDYFNLENWDLKNSKGSCPFGHNDDTPSFIYNHKNNSFHCFSCSRNFGILDLFMAQGNTYLGAVEKLFELTGTRYKFGERFVKTKRNYKYPVVDCVEDRSKVEAYFANRKISKETLDYCDVGQDKYDNIVWKFYDENDTLMTVKLRPTVKNSYNEKMGKEWFLPGFDQEPILFNMNKVDHSNGPLVICEGQVDLLSIIESGYFSAVSVPGGSANMKWIDSCYDWLSQFDQIVIWGDQDEAGIKMRKDAIARLGQWRCRFVEIPEELQVNKNVKDANAILYHFGKQKVLDLIANAQEAPISGVANLSDVEDFSIEKALGIYTKIGALDDVLYKILFGNVVVVTGQRSSGKSSLVNQLFVAEALDQGYASYIFSGELSGPVLKSWLNLTMIGPDFIKMKNKFIHLVDVGAKKELEKWYEGQVFLYNDKKSNDAENILDKAVSVIRKYGCKVIILDNLSVINIGNNDSNLYEKQKEFMTKLIAMADLYNVLIVLVVHPRKLQTGMEISSDDVGGSGAITNLAQYVISAKRYTDKEKRGEKDAKGNVKKDPIDEDVAISVLKNRHVGRTGEIKLYFDYKSRRFYDTVENLNKRYGWDKRTDPLSKYDPRIEKMPEQMRGD